MKKLVKCYFKTMFIKLNNVITLLKDKKLLFNNQDTTLIEGDYGFYLEDFLLEEEEEDSFYFYKNIIIWS